MARADTTYKGRSAGERQAERHRRFLDAGLDLFGAGPGYRATKVVDLCKAAGLSTRQFYEEFDSLEDVLAELHLYVNNFAQQAVLEALPRAADLPLTERIARMVRAYVEGAAGDPRHARISYVEIVGVSPRLDRQRLDRRALWIEFIDDIAGQAVERGEVAPEDHHLAAAAFIGAVNGLMHDWVVGWVDATRDEIADELLRLLLGRYGFAYDLTTGKRRAP
ncbi:TetR/AcrR family transcriptional regulator [Streptomyces sp. Da 82-17]|uniref:TetR/AcrR family transcriptional regulator n=1 Tax=Streptomyces sp. Da 82-17 TaxID=3377116 RepID=UPI0038D3874F